MSSVSRYMRKKVTTIGTEASAAEASKTMLREKIGYLVVTEKNKAIGMITERDLVVKVMARDLNPSTTRVSEFMSTPLVTTDPDKLVGEALAVMKKNGFRRLPVVKNDVIYGVFTSKDLLEHYDELEDDLVKRLVYLAVENPVSED